MRLCLIGSVLIAAVVGSTPSPETTEYLANALTGDEKEYLYTWAKESIETDVQASVLEKLLTNTSCKNTELLEYVNQRNAVHFETLKSVASRRIRALWIAFQPAWFHDALVSSVEPISPPSEELLTRLESLRPYPSPLHLRTREGLARTAAMWDALCLTPLKAYNGSGEPPCVLRAIPSDGEITSWYSLRGFVIRDHIFQSLRKLRTGKAL